MNFNESGSYLIITSGNPKQNPLTYNSLMMAAAAASFTVSTAAAKLSSSFTGEATKCAALASSRPSQSPFSKKFTFARSKSTSIRCTIAKETVVPMETAKKLSDPATWLRPDSFGRFGKFGGKYVPETLMYALSELESAFYKLATDQEFQVFVDLVFQ